MGVATRSVSTSSTETFGSLSTTTALEKKGLATDARGKEALATTEFLRNFRRFIGDIARTQISIHTSVASEPVRARLRCPPGYVKAIDVHAVRGDRQSRGRLADRGFLHFDLHRLAKVVGGV